MSFEYDRITKISIICSFPVKRTDPNCIWKKMKFFYDLIDTDFGTIKLDLNNVKYCFQIWLISDKTKYEKYICGSNIVVLLNCEDKINLEKIKQVTLKSNLKTNQILILNCKKHIEDVIEFAILQYLMKKNILKELKLDEIKKEVQQSLQTPKISAFKEIASRELNPAPFNV